jgi:hypothetical protein
LKRAVAYSLFLVIALFGLLDSYGMDVISEIMSSIFHAVIDFVVLLFVIGIFLAIFSAPIWVKKIFGGMS